MGPNGGCGGGGGGAVESYGELPERCHGIRNLSQLVNSSVLRVHISLI